MLKYLNRAPKKGDIVECIEPFENRYTMGSIYIVKAIHDNSVQVTECDDGFTEDHWSIYNFKVINPNKHISLKSLYH